MTSLKIIKILLKTSVTGYLLEEKVHSPRKYSGSVLS